MERITLKSDQFWVKIVDFLQQNWALIEHSEHQESVTIYFIQDASMIFDSIEYNTMG